ncbi:PHP domain-containing protein [Staphylococcus hyicus]|uniref:PHP domain-containing protein n=1 Tax=Staphylococcus hyicus TaxID=1284 RepID=UPI0027385A30|nr:PHP domain-containing protein [Staphylococcus hyicus]MDP4448300.1 PHP domain-containing protein [Staphylococcus hyicus]MDP4459784.1 PHP domain-containing protein [Staphylococcus hyicus]
MNDKLKLCALHNHSDFSNFRLIDAITRTEELLLTADMLGYSALAITEHESIASSVQILKDLNNLKNKGKLKTLDKLIFGNEIYLVDSLEEVRDNYQSGVTKFPHFILMAKNRKGFEALSKLSSQAWKNSFFTGLMERTPTTKEFLRQVVHSNEYKDTLLATSACVGSNVNIPLIRAMEAENEGNLSGRDNLIDKSRKEITWCIETFGKDNFFLELQPALSEVQKYCNKWLVKFSKEFGLKCVLANDTHYARPGDREIHKIFLNSKESSGFREVDEFYYYCYMHSKQEMEKQMDYLGGEVVQEALLNTCAIYDLVEEYDLQLDPVIPKSTIPEFQIRHIFRPAYDKYTYIKYLAESEYEDDRYLLYLIEEGYFNELHYDGISSKEFHKILDRINQELKEIIGVGKKINQTMTSYYLTCREIVNIMWQDDECGGQSLVGSGRGSGAGFLINYLLGITQINPLDYYNMPHTRHLSSERVQVGADAASSIPDIDVDCEGSKRQQIIHALKNHYGEDRVLNVCTYGTEGAKSAIKMACRGLGIPDTEGQYLGSFIKTERGSQWSINDTLYGNEEKGRKPDTQFRREMEKHPKLIEVATRLEGLTTRRGIHAGGVIIFNDEAFKNNAIMTASKGSAHVTQFNLSDSEYTGGVKFDLLSVENLSRIRETLDLLAKDGLIDDSKSLRENFRDLLHPKNLDLENKEYFDMASKGDISDLFQFSTEIGRNSVIKVSPNSFEEFCAANSLMRLQSEDGEQPIDKYIRHKENIQLWYDEMKNWGLNSNEIKVMEKHLLHDFGLNITQEVSMALSADPKISNFDILEQNKLRKVIAKPKGAALDEIKSLFYRRGFEQGTRKELLDYVWEVQFKMQMSYSFSQLHVTAYSIIGIQNLELNRSFPRIYWQTACLNVDSDSISEDSKDIDYAKIANGIGKIKSYGVEVKLPDINKSDLAFTPDVENNAIIYGLKPVKSLNSKIVADIIANRPYNSVEDVLTKLYDTNLITNTHLIAMVKSGMLDNISKSRKSAMMDVIRHITKLPDKLTMQNIKLLIEADILKDRKERDLIMLRESFNKNVLRKVQTGNSKSKHKIFRVDNMELYNKLCGDVGIVEVHNNYYEVDEKEFKKFFDKQIGDLKEWLKTEEPLKIAHSYLLNDQWIKYALGSYSKWEMETLSFYYHDHELADVNKETYNISSYCKLPENPIVVDKFKFKGREMPKYQILNIAGVVIAKDPNKHIVTILTSDGSVVPVKYQGNFSAYDKTIKRDGKVIEKSWFSKGNLLIISGFRRGNQFVAKKYADSNTSTTTKLIDYVGNNGEITYKLDRELL